MAAYFLLIAEDKIYKQWKDETNEMDIAKFNEKLWQNFLAQEERKTFWSIRKSVIVFQDMPLDAEQMDKSVPIMQRTTELILLRMVEPEADVLLLSDDDRDQSGGRRGGGYLRISTCLFRRISVKISHMYLKRDR